MVSLSSEKTLLLIRPAVQSYAFLSDLEAQLGKKTNNIVSPIINIVFQDASIEVDNYQGGIFTSVNGVEGFIRSGGQASKTVVCVGDRTASAALSVGMDAISTNGRAEDVIKKVTQIFLPDNGPLFYSRGATVSRDIAAALEKIGYQVTEFVTYSQAQVPLSAAAISLLTSNEHVVLPVFSQHAANTLCNFIKANPNIKQNTIHLVAISDEVAEALKGINCASKKTAKEPSRQGMLEKVKSYFL